METKKKAMENNKIVDNRGRNFDGGFARLDVKSYRFTCCHCDGEFLSADSCMKHIDLVHNLPIVIGPKVVTKQEKVIVKQEIIEINSDDNDDGTDSDLICLDDVEKENEKVEVPKNGEIGKAAMPKPPVGNQQKNEPSTSAQSSEHQHQHKPLTSVQSNGNQQQNKPSTSAQSDEYQHQQKPSTSVESNEKQSQRFVSPRTLRSAQKRKISSDLESLTASDDSSTQEPTQSTPNQQSRNDETNNNNRSFIECRYCSTQFDSPLEVNRHKKDCKPWNDSEYKCEYCDKGYLIKLSLKHHEAKCHPEQFPFECNDCDRRYRTDDELYAHVQRHCNGTIVRCFFCGQEFVTTFKRNQHVKSAHKNMANVFGEFVCPICDKTFKTDEMLRNHNQEVHKCA